LVDRRLHDLPARQAASDPDAVALWWQGAAASYRQLWARARHLAGRLAAAGEPGERVGVLAWNCPAFIDLVYAASAAGRLLVPLNARLAPAELAYQLRHAEVTRLFADPGLLQPLRDHPDFPSDVESIALGPAYDAWLNAGPVAPLPPTAGSDPAWILFTSGTTGRPKGAVLTHDSLLAGLRAAALGRPVEAGDRYYYPFPLFHVAAHNVLLQHQHGAAVVLARSFDPAETLAACRELGVTTLSLAPTMIGMLLDHPTFEPADLSGVRTIGYGASNMPPDLLQRLLYCTDVGLCQSYGMTELSGSVSFLTPADHRLAAAGGHDELLRSVGRPLPTAAIRLAGADGAACEPGEAGEILVRGAQCMAGYWRDPASTRATLVDGWLHTGDIGRFDADGYLYIVDRNKDMIVSGGENVASREVEEVLRRHPAVRDCAVIGVPDARWGEAVGAVVVVSGTVTDEALAAHCRGHLAGYKTPRHWWRRESLPINAAGKVDKAALRQSVGTVL
jgi:acyl-CoA synthetase (AMP-forming)/AMP-acid ligase II